MYEIFNDFSQNHRVDDSTCHLIIAIVLVNCLPTLTFTLLFIIPQRKIIQRRQIERSWGLIDVLIARNYLVSKPFGQ